MTARPRATAAGAAVLAGAVVAACEPDPALFVGEFEAALASGRPDVIEPLLTASSRPLVAALVAARGAAGAGLRPVHRPVAIVAQSPHGQRLRVEVKEGGVRREWVLVREAGRWRLDLADTAARRPWSP